MNALSYATNPTTEFIGDLIRRAVAFERDAGLFAIKLKAYADLKESVGQDPDSMLTSQMRQKIDSYFREAEEVIMGFSLLLHPGDSIEHDMQIIANGMFAASDVGFRFTYAEIDRQLERYRAQVADMRKRYFG